MLVLKTAEELSSTLNTSGIATKSITFNYTTPDLVTQEIYTSDYKCGCGDKHSVSGSDGSITIMQEMKLALGINVVLKCKNNWHTYVKKGVLGSKWKSVWTIKSSVFDKAVENDFHYNNLIRPYLSARDS